MHKYFFRFLVVFMILNLTITCQSKEKQKAAHKNNFSGILKVTSGGELLRNDKLYRGIGVNYFNAFYRTILNQSNKSYKEGFKYLGENKIPFIRFSANGFWPSDFKLYQMDKARYYMLLDEFVKEAESNGIGLIPSLFWYYAAIPDLVGEHMDQWGNPKSKTIAFMRSYTAEMVTRYKDSPAIWAWEFGNEMNLSVDFLERAMNSLPKVNPSAGTPEKRTSEDINTTEILRCALNEFAATVRKYDPNRAIFSGNAIPNPNMYHRYKYKNWLQDSSTEFTALLDLQNPSSLGTLTIHPYPSVENSFFSDFKADLSTIIQEAMRSSKELKRPLFIGEFGSPKTYGAEKEAQKFNDLLNGIIAYKVPLSALWVFDYSPQDADWNVTPTNSRKYQLDEIIKANAQFRAESFQ